MDKPLEFCIFMESTKKSILQASLKNASDCHLSAHFIYHFTLSTALKFIIIAAINNRDQMSRLSSVWCTSFLWSVPATPYKMKTPPRVLDDVRSPKNTKCKLLGFDASFLSFFAFFLLISPLHCEYGVRVFLKIQKIIIRLIYFQLISVFF